MGGVKPAWFDRRRAPASREMSCLRRPDAMFLLPTIKIDVHCYECFALRPNMYKIPYGLSIVPEFMFL